MEIIFNKDKAELLKSAAEALKKEFEVSKDVPRLILFSGGSALGILNHLDLVLNEKDTVGPVDERWTKRIEDLNWTGFSNSDFFKKNVESGANFIRIKVIDTKSPADSAKVYERELQNWFAKNAGGRVLAVFGVGQDGHTGGVMPFPEKQKWFDGKFLSDDLVVGYDAKAKSPFPERVTVSLRFIRDHVNFDMIYATGEEKKTALKRMLKKTGTLSETPARIHKEIPQSFLFTDMEI